jgi:AbrB family looped-hinge helix DNA binding protein
VSHVPRFSGNAKLDDRGRLVLPANIRSRLGFKPGDEVRISEESDGSLRVENRRNAAHALIGLAGPLDHSALEDLADDRREQAAAEETAPARPGQILSAAADTVGER